MVLFILPGLISLYYVLRGQSDKAFLNIYLPCTFLLPYYYAFRLPHVPVLPASDFALLPIAFAVLLRPKRPWQFRRMDLWVLIFVVSFAISEMTREFNPKDGASLWLQVGFVEMFLAYVVGRQVIEPDLRLETVKRIIFLFILQTPLAFFEYRFGRNLWLEAGKNIFRLNDVAWFVQLRGGTARIATCFSDAILAGMMFMIGIALNYYMVQIYKLDRTRLGPKMSMLQKYRIPFFLLPIFVFMTGSRMPMACSVLTFLFLQIPRFKNMKTGAITILLVAGIGFGIVYSYYDRYTSVAADESLSEQQSSAVYRKELTRLYAPILEEGGWLGYGSLSHPSVIGLGSIDNAYILVQLGQGKLGVYTFEIIALESIFGLILCATRFKLRESLFIVFSLLGGMIGLFVSLRTVALYETTTQVLFLLLGWAQSLQDIGPVGANSAVANSLAAAKFKFKRVIA